MEEEKHLDVGLNFIQMSTHWDAFPERSPGPLDRVGVDTPVHGADKVLRVVDFVVGVIQVHVLQLVVAGPTVRVDDRPALDILKDDLRECVL